MKKRYIQFPWVYPLPLVLVAHAGALESHQTTDASFSIAPK